MNTDKEIILAKGIAIAQSIIAPGLLAIGFATNNKIMTRTGAVWCGLIALDTARTTMYTINLVAEQVKQVQNDLWNS